MRNALFLRDVDEQMNSLQVEWLSRATVGFVCECSRVGCREPIYLSVGEFAATRGPGRFVTAPGHADELLSNEATNACTNVRTGLSPRPAVGFSLLQHRNV
jgi:hypothetical protein